MKKGCFLKVIAILTILVAAITYIIQNKFNEYLLGPSKKIIVPLFIENLSKNIKFVKESSQKDSLLTLVKNYANDVKDLEELSDDSIKDFIQKIQSISVDSVITNEELDNIKKFIKIRSSDERSTEN
ncbi:MAG TPA: hypothetical protein VKA26_09105 [Ignavibacteriaceae bacterium]|nr:hypothetical protein [Ignavibacteriaceae bacterium]